LEVGAEGGFKLDLRQDCDPGRQDCDPGKQELKGAVRTETYQHHYCQQEGLRAEEQVFTMNTEAFQLSDLQFSCAGACCMSQSELTRIKTQREVFF
jgi:hypothetical protein